MTNKNMERLLMASIMTRVILSVVISALIVGTVAIFILVSAKTEWKEAVANYDKYYSGGDQVRCENLFSKFELSNSQPACEVGIPSQNGSMTQADSLADLDRGYREFKECLSNREAIRNRSITALWTSGCPINEYRWGVPYAQTKAPTLGTLDSPGSLMEFGLRKSSISFELLIVSFPLTAIFLFFSTVVARAIYTDPHLGWKRLMIVLSLVLTPVPLVIYAQSNGPDPVATFFLLVLGLFGSAALLVIARKTTVWIRSGFNGQVSVHPTEHASAIPPDAGKINQSGASNFAAATLPMGKTDEVQDAEADSLESARQVLLALPLASPGLRFFARTIDLWTLTLPVAFASGFFLDHQFTVNPYFFGLISLPFVLLLEAAISAAFGNSPGKALLAIRLTTIRGRRLTFNDYVARGFNLYIYGLALGIPFISLFPMIKQYQNLNAGRPASYDQGRFSVRVSDLGTGRKVVAGIALLVLFSIPGCLSAISR
jgi:hypothetical protein